MPMNLNVGLSRKVGEANYGSRGATVNVEIELDAALIKKTERLKEKIRQLFALVRTSLSEELDRGHRSDASVNGTSKQGKDGAPQPAERQRPATQFQIKALMAIAKNKDLSLDDIVKDRFHADKPEALSLRQASQLIDELKKGGS
jgi:hypothetical protein